jgi:Mg-chelatase subunit ChlD
MLRRGLAIGTGLLLAAGASGAERGPGELKVEIHAPHEGQVFTSLEPEVAVEGGASVFGGVRYLDLFLVIDSSKSLLQTDPKDQRAAGAVALVRSLPARSDVQIGVVEFSGKAELMAPLTADRNAIVAALRGLGRSGSTNLAAGIRAALDGFETRARPESSRVVLLFTDGKSDEDDTLEAMQEARRRGVAIHTLQLGSDRDAGELLAAVARGTGGSFLRVTDPARLPEAFLGLRTTGVEHVTLSANGGAPVPAPLAGGSFSVPLTLRPGENTIVATATSLDGETRQASVHVFLTDELTLRIETPLPGTLYTDRETQAVVTGTATLFAGIAPERLADHPDHGIREVLLRVDDSPPFVTQLLDGRFEGRVLLHEGENRILATATAIDGRVADAAVPVTVRPPGCGELKVQALRDGSPALSVSDRAVELVVDASGSMWAQLGGRSKMSVAQEILDGALDWMPGDLSLALRVYGHQQPREKRDCKDSQLLVPFGPESRERIREATASIQPRGQTPLGYSLEQVAADFGAFRGERAVVLVTDGIESCGGDPVAAARRLAQDSVAVHVIGFGLGGEDEDQAALRAIAEASGGRFLTAGSADELREALSVTVGTAFRVSRAGQVVAAGTLGTDETIRLPSGAYTVHLDSRPPREVPVELASEEAFTLLLERRQETVTHQALRSPAEYFACREPSVAGSSPGQPAAAPAESF